jgi:hypothetical protein
MSARLRDRAPRWGVGLAVLVLAPPAARAQRLAEQPGQVMAAARQVGAPRDTTAPATFSIGDLARRQWLQPVASLVVPGSGQLLRRQDRGLVYLAAEVWLVARAAALTSQGRRGRRGFQDLAYQVARAQFTPVRRDGDFAYYEAMTKYVESGEYDRDPGPGFQPEQDTLTFNGAVWLLARRTYLVNPDSLPDEQSPPYQAALSFYTRRAVGDDLRWSWRDARLEQDVFRAAIHSSDDAFRTATNYLGGLVLNHLGSAIDALITIRVGARPGSVPQVSPGQSPGEWRLVWSREF